MRRDEIGTADPTGTYRTAWAAGWGNRPCHVGAGRADAENAVLDALSELLDDGTLKPEDLVATPMVVYRDVLWCLGDDDYCPCGGPHPDEDTMPWGMISYVGRDEGRISVGWPSTDHDGYDLEVTDAR